MPTLLRSTPRLLTIWINGTPPYTMLALYKAGVSTAISDGAITDNGDGSIMVSWDVTDTDTVGDFAFLIKDSAPSNFGFDGYDVWDRPIGLLPNDGNSTVNLTSLNLISGTGVPALVIQSTVATVSAAQLLSLGDGLEVVATQNGFNIHLCSNAILLKDCIRGLVFDTMTDGIWQQSITNLGALLQGDNFGLFCDGPSGSGLVASGLMNGARIDCTSGGMPANAVCALSIRSNGIGMRVRSTTNAAIVLLASTAGILVTVTSGVAILSQGVDYLVRIADKVLNLADGIEPGRTLGWAMRIVLGAVGGKSFLAGASRTYRDTNDTVNRITATTDNQGQRNSVTYNA